MIENDFDFAIFLVFWLSNRVHVCEVILAFFFSNSSGAADANLTIYALFMSLWFICPTVSTASRPAHTSHECLNTGRIVYKRCSTSGRNTESWHGLGLHFMRVCVVARSAD